MLLTLQLEQNYYRKAEGSFKDWWKLEYIFELLPLVTAAGWHTQLPARHRIPTGTLFTHLSAMSGHGEPGVWSLHSTNFPPRTTRILFVKTTVPYRVSQLTSCLGRLRGATWLGFSDVAFGRAAPAPVSCLLHPDSSLQEPSRAWRNRRRLFNVPSPLLLVCWQMVGLKSDAVARDRVSLQAFLKWTSRFLYIL